MQLSLAGQVAVVTGASSGLGRGIAEAFAEAGAAVVVNYHGGVEAAAEVVRGIEATGGQALAVQADVADPDAVARMFEAAAARFGGIDILVANSGVQQDAPIADMSLQDWHKVISTNLTGQFLCCQAALRRFRAQGRRPHSRALGKILCMSSVHDRIPWAGHANYAAAKGGVAMLMQTLAQEVAAEGIRINAIAPGAIRTRINAEARAEGEAKMLELIPYGRVGEPADVARAALFLVSDLADYVVGTTLYVDGGMTLYPGFRGNG
ncbi:3-oxoacyl-ACP reductase FabG [Roseomonas sp. USHLN139]|uniref:3-oxoacyl-ACP reductase FabG n=1 Tax=Roseomonas sp. USHLN139 TaxID=3081298 RepID=UPI003B01BC2F